MAREKGTQEQRYHQSQRREKFTETGVTIESSNKVREFIHLTCEIERNSLKLKKKNHQQDLLFLSAFLIGEL